MENWVQEVWEIIDDDWDITISEIRSRLKEMGVCPCSEDLVWTVNQYRRSSASANQNKKLD